MRPRPCMLAAVTAVFAVPAAGFGALGVSPLRYFAPASPFGGLAPETTSLALNARGDAVVGELIRSGNGSQVTPTVRTRNGARGPWTRTIRLAAPTADTSEPIVRINATGGAIAVFERNGVYVASRRRTNAWQLKRIGAPGPATQDTVNVSLLPNGRARFVQALPDVGCDPDATACMWTAAIYDQAGAGAIWVRRTDTLRFGPTQQPVISSSRRGDMLIAWAGAGGSPTISASRRLISETAFEAPLTVSPAGVRGDAIAAIGDDGDAVIGWILPDAPGTGTTFTGALQVSVRPANSPIWANAENVVQPGAPNPDGTLAIDNAGNVAVAWTTFDSGTGATDTLRAAIRSAATAQWSPSPVLGTASIGDGESLRNPRVLIESGRAFVYSVRHLGPGTNEPRLSIGTAGGTWNTRTLSGNADPSASSRDAIDYLIGASPSGRLLLAGDGLQVRNYDAATTKLPARADRIRVTVSGRRAILSFRLNAAARVFVQRTSGPAFRTVGQYAAQQRGAGPNTFRLGTLPPGRYRVAVGACNASRGCAVSASVTFRIR